MTRNQIAKIFSHCVYDGVYATAEERVRGGGSLSLKTKFAIWLGLPEDEFNGCWDLGHNLQLVYSDALRKNKQFKKFNTMMYKYMQNNKLGSLDVDSEKLAITFFNQFYQIKVHRKLVGFELS